KRAIYADAEFRRSLREKVDGGRLAQAFRSMQITEHPPDPSLAERRLGDVAAERGVHPVDLALDLSLASGLATRFRLAVLNTDETVVAELLSHPASMLGLSDAGAHASPLWDACVIRAAVLSGVGIPEDGREDMEPGGPPPGRVLRGGHA